MRIYQGVDMVDLPRFRSVSRRSTGFLADIFSEKEREYCLSKRDPDIHFAGRFAAKEAGLKALGIGMTGSGIDNTLREIEVLPGPSGKPVLSFSGWAEKIRRKKGIRQLTVSISHTDSYAVATVILTGEDAV